MIKKFKLYILIAAVAFSATSCLDKMSEGTLFFPATPAEFRL